MNQFRGILAFPRLDCYWLRPFGRDPVLVARYLELSYDEADVLGVGSASPVYMLPGALSLAAATVVAEVFP